jgi:Tol biopolymer transport system component
MPDVRETFHAVTRDIAPEPGALERQRRLRVDRETKRRRDTFILVAALLVAVAGIGLAGVPRDVRRPTTASPLPGASLLVVGLDGTVRSTLGGLPLGAGMPDLSPNGTTIAFTIVHGPNSRIATMRDDGTSLRLLTPNTWSAEWPRWSADGRRLLFYRVKPHGNLVLMVMSADGADIRRVPGPRTPDAQPPDLSPDGTEILYTTRLRIQYDLATVPTGGGRSSRLTDSVLAFEGGGTWSPDGTTIAFERLVSDRYELWLMNADGTEERRLVALGSADAMGPEWSPDGTRIAFIGSTGSVAGSDPPDSGLYVVEVATGEVTEIPLPFTIGTGHTARATWTPDGDALLVVSAAG